MNIHKFLTNLIITIVFTMVAGISPAQTYQAETIQRRSDFQWPEGKKTGLSLTFDDARLSQVDKGIPLLDKYGVKATFIPNATVGVFISFRLFPLLFFENQDKLLSLIFLFSIFDTAFPKVLVNS